MREATEATDYVALAYNLTQMTKKEATYYVGLAYHLTKITKQNRPLV